MARPRDGAEHAREFPRLGRSEHALLGMQDAGNVPFAQRCLHQAGLPVFQHEHGDVARTEFLSPEAGVAAEQAEDFGGDQARQGRLGGGLGDAGRALGARQEPEVQRRLGPAVFGERFLVRLAAGLDRLETDFIEDKRLVHRTKEDIDSLDETFLRTPVLFQGKALIHLPGGFQVSENVRAPEAVDRLLRIADEKEQGEGSTGVAP